MNPMPEMKTEVVSYGNGIWAIDQVMMRSFLVVGETGALLFDTGAQSCAMEELVRSVTDLPLTVVHSHTDGDHTANDSLFPCIYMHPAEEDYMREKPAGTRYEPVTEGTVFDLGGRSLQVIEAPGHTPGSICLLDSENGVLFSGDTISHGPVFLFSRGRNIRLYRSTLAKLQAAPGFDRVYPCHNTCPVGREVIDELIRAVDGALDGSIAPAQSNTPLPPDAGDLKVYCVGSSSILCDPAELAEA